MPLKTRPLNNNCLIEVFKEHDTVSRADENEDMSFGRLIDFSVTAFHLTASAAHIMDGDTVAYQKLFLKSRLGMIVRWEQYAEGGQTFEENGKTYALVPWWRLISVTEE